MGTFGPLPGGTAQIDFVGVTVDYIGSNRPGNYGKRVSVGAGMSRSEGAS